MCCAVLADRFPDFQISRFPICVVFADGEGILNCAVFPSCILLAESEGIPRFPTCVVVYRQMVKSPFCSSKINYESIDMPVVHIPRIVDPDKKKCVVHQKTSRARTKDIDFFSFWMVLVGTSSTWRRAQLPALTRGSHPPNQLISFLKRSPMHHAVLNHATIPYRVIVPLGVRVCRADPKTTTRGLDIFHVRTLDCRMVF